jgi:hypothetical protein
MGIIYLAKIIIVGPFYWKTPGHFVVYYQNYDV